MPLAPAPDPRAVPLRLIAADGLAGWLERQDPATRAWVAAQNRLTAGYLGALPEREELRRRLTELWDFPRWGVPFRKGDRYFFVRHDGLRNQSVLYTQDHLDGEPRVLVDPNQLSGDGTVALAAFNLSEDGRYLAYGLTNGGSDWQEWRVREVETGRDLPDLLRWVKFSQSAWTHQLCSTKSRSEGIRALSQTGVPEATGRPPEIDSGPGSGVLKVLDGIAPGDHLQAVALDGFAAELPAASLLASQGAKAWLAVEDPAQPWPPLGQGKPSAGPFYLVWTDPAASQIGPEQWPFQVSRIRQLAPVAQRFPALLPTAEASAEVQAGFAQFQKHCLACHRLNGAGDSAFGPDLNIPHNPTEYLGEAFLRLYIRDPQSLRKWPQGRMPGFSEAVLSERELNELLGYLQHMAKHRR